MRDEIAAHWGISPSAVVLNLIPCEGRWVARMTIFIDGHRTRLSEVGLTRQRAREKLLEASQIRAEMAGRNATPGEGVDKKMSNPSDDNPLKRALDTLADVEPGAAELIPHELQRAIDLRDQARAMCEQRTRERDEARATIEQLAYPAAVGQAVLDLLAQLRRMRTVPRERLPGSWNFTPDNIADSVLREVEELRREDPGTDAAIDELGDVLATVFDLTIAHDVGPVQCLGVVIRKLKRRLSAVECGQTWDEAKASE